jgi:SUMO ligase MMS21 Smc5/6 complex component
MTNVPQINSVITSLETSEITLLMISKLKQRYNIVYKLINYYIMNVEYTSMNIVITKQN